MWVWHGSLCVSCFCIVGLSSTCMLRKNAVVVIGGGDGGDRRPLSGIPTITPNLHPHPGPQVSMGPPTPTPWPIHMHQPLKTHRPTCGNEE